MHYRLYTLDRYRGTIRTGVDLQAVDDDDALAQGTAVHSNGESFEIWCGQRLVYRTLVEPSYRDA